MDFRFNDSNFSATKLALFDDCLITLFVIITLLNLYSSSVFYNLNSKFACFIMMTIFWFYGIIRFRFNSDSPFKSLPINDFLDDSTMWLCILLILISISKGFSSGLIIINSQFSYFLLLFAFQIFCIYFCLYVFIYQLLYQLLVYVQENTNQFCSLKQNVRAVFFRFQILSFFC